MKRKKFLALTLAAAMSLALFSGCSRPSASSGGNDNPSANNTGSTSSEEPIVIKIGHTDSDTRSTHKWSVWLGEWLEEQAPGRPVGRLPRHGGRCKAGHSHHGVRPILRGKFRVRTRD